MYAFMPEDPITDDSEPPCGCWESNSGPLEDQTVLLTTEPSLQLQNLIFWVKKKAVSPLSYFCQGIIVIAEVSLKQHSFVYDHVCRGQRSMLGIFIALHLILLRQGLVLSPGLTDLTRLASQ